MFKTDAMSSGPTTARSSFTHSPAKLSLIVPDPVALATNALFPSDTKPEFKNLLSRRRVQELRGKTAITGRQGEKLNTGTLVPSF